MAIFQVFTRDNFRRLTLVIRRDGWRAAMLKIWRFFAMRLRPAQQHDEAHLDPFWQNMAQLESFHVSQPPAYLTRTRRIAMIGDMNLPQCRKYRIEQPQELWAGMGVDYNFSYYGDVQRAVALLQNATHLMFYRTQNDPRMNMYLYEARRLRLPIAYDLDDPLFSVSAYETYENMKALPASMKAHFLSEAPKYLGAMNQADLLTVSTPGMAEHTRAFTQRPVYVRRNFADTQTLTAAKAALDGASGKRDQTQFRVAFASGSQGHEVDFALIGSDMIDFLAADANRHLVILGHFNKDLLPKELQDRVESHPFTTYELYLETLASVDCAVMPLCDDLFNRCKSAVRVIDAAAVGVPSLVGQISDMAVMVQDGKTGRVLGPDDTWRDALEELAANRAATASMGQAARHALLKDWVATPGLPVIDPDLISWVKG